MLDSKSRMAVDWQYKTIFLIVQIIICQNELFKDVLKAPVFPFFKLGGAF